MKILQALFATLYYSTLAGSTVVFLYALFGGN